MAKGKFGEEKAKPWNGKDLKGIWELTLKIDGARMLRNDKGKPVSRADKPLYNLEGVPKTITDAEIYNGSWETSMGLVRRSVNGSPVPLTHVYSLDPLDPRLEIGLYENPTAEFLQRTMEGYVAQGYEGLILRQTSKKGIVRWLKVKPKETADVFVTAWFEGEGKYVGMMGKLQTDYGKVGTGFTDLQREMFTEKNSVGLLIEVEYMSMTPGLKFRHARFKRVRTDKTEENLPWLEQEDES
jgi:hypothetical protein